MNENRNELLHSQEGTAQQDDPQIGGVKESLCTKNLPFSSLRKIINENLEWTKRGFIAPPEIETAIDFDQIYFLGTKSVDLGEEKRIKNKAFYSPANTNPVNFYDEFKKKFSRSKPNAPINVSFCADVCSDLESTGTTRQAAGMTKQDWLCFMKLFLSQYKERIQSIHLAELNVFKPGLSQDEIESDRDFYRELSLLICEQLNPDQCIAIGSNSGGHSVNSYGAGTTALEEMAWLERKLAESKESFKRRFAYFEENQHIPNKDLICVNQLGGAINNFHRLLALSREVWSYLVKSQPKVTFSLMGTHDQGMVFVWLMQYFQKEGVFVHIDTHPDSNSPKIVERFKPYFTPYDIERSSDSANSHGMFYYLVSKLCIEASRKCKR